MCGKQTAQALAAAIILGTGLSNVLAEPFTAVHDRSKTFESHRDPIRLNILKPRLSMHAVAKPLREVSMTTSVSGSIAEVFVKDGDRVKTGQPLLRFDRRLSEARMEMAHAELQSSLSSMKSTELESKLATTRYTNLLEAYHQNAATQVELKEAHVRMQQARARYAAAVDSAKQMEESENYASVENELRQVVAPFDGVAVRVLAVPGQTPSVNQPLVQIVDTSKLRVDMYLPISSYAELKSRKTFMLQAEAPVNRELNAMLVVIDSVIDPATQTIRCILEIDNQNGTLPSGFRLRLKPEIDTELESVQE